MSQISFETSSVGEKQCEPCEDCEIATPPTFFCVDCGSNYCDACWAKAPPHKQGKVNRDGLPHEKINKDVAARLKEIFTPTSDPKIQRRLHEEDRDTTWFGVCRGTSGHPELQDYGRYSRLIRESWNGKFRERWPQLVSFVGQTGSGKSTLVKILIDYRELSEKSKLAEGVGFRSPVAGSVNDQAPTSGDVHLYADPKTFVEQYPMLYADCEGLDGGERIPVGAQHQEVGLAAPFLETAPRRRSSSLSVSSYSLPNKLRKVHKYGKAAKRELRWATDPESCKREFAVRQLYPRLLYAFSDVVVFVLRNERTFETGALVPMLEWASSSIEGVVGQPAKPHVIIISNFTDTSIDPKGWDVRSATKSLLKTHSAAIHDNVDVKRHAQYWEGVTRPVRTTMDLLLCYYSSVDVVRVPQKGRYGLLSDQIGKLHECIKRRCLEARENKKRLRVMFNTEEFQTALSMGFDHFSTRLDDPLDFVELSYSLNPIPKDFGGNILRLALAIKNDPKFKSASGSDIFKHLGHMVASCIMLDYTRRHIKGTPARLLKHYEENYNRALVEFCHQNAKGKILMDGVYRSAFDFTEETYREVWQATLDGNLQHIRKQMDKKTTGEFAMGEEKVATDLHRKLMTEFYSNMGDLEAYTNHSACFCCLRELPEHPLPCGHVLCTPCIKSFAAKKDNVSYTMDHCPLHPTQTRECQIPIKPSLAGVRILTLDGYGGVRGIVELEVLHLIQRELGKLPITSFFDLIVGTSTGGFIGLGLGVKEWAVNECTSRFINLCDRAFTPREFPNVPILNVLATINHSSKYKTKPFEDALRKTFEEDLLFGGHCDTARYQRKVAVVSSLNPGRRAAILTNYNRLQKEPAPDYKFERPEKAEEELKMWEACRATSAATGYFKPVARSVVRDARSRVECAGAIDKTICVSYDTLNISYIEYFLFK
ncbi:hypothetical protein BDZ45DRAFT_733176 [Acephala macrosclerotiorum]|nr:hypothetical protein BDZ45DRAFT_733176 [Acephala macrosclerotiorum]